MATRKKVKRDTKAKRKKTPTAKAAARGKTATSRKKPAKKALVRRGSPKKARLTASVTVKPTPAQPVTTQPTPSMPAQPAPREKRIGVVTHYYSHASVATLRLEPGATLRVGDVIHIRGHTTDFSQKVESLEVNHAPVTEVGPNDDFGLKVVEHSREHDEVFKVQS